MDRKEYMREYMKRYQQEHKEQYNKRMNDYYHKRVKQKNTEENKVYNDFKDYLISINLDINSMSAEEIKEEYNKYIER